MIQRDYIERLIEQCADALRRALRLRQDGELDGALRSLREAADRLVGPLRPMLDGLEASSAVDVAGRFQVDRVRVYAALLSEEGLVHESRGDASRAALSCRRALELYAAISLAGGGLLPADVERIALLTARVSLDELAPRYADELRRRAASGA